MEISTVGKNGARQKEDALNIKINWAGETKAEVTYPVSEKMGFATVVLRLSLVMIAVPVIGQSYYPGRFPCKSYATCRSLVGYAPRTRTTFGAIQSLFDVSDLTELLGVNSLPESTRPDDPVEAKGIIRIPIECKCYGTSGRSNKRPIYKIQQNDTFYLVATKNFSGLVTYEVIEQYNPELIPTNLTIGQEVWIPLPCSCSTVNGSHTKNLLHYGFIFQYGSTLEQIGKDYGTTPAAIMSTNGLYDPKEIQTGFPLDVPLTGFSFFFSFFPICFS